MSLKFSFPNYCQKENKYIHTYIKEKEGEPCSILMSCSSYSRSGPGEAFIYIRNNNPLSQQCLIMP